jgi:flavin reductase
MTQDILADSFRQAMRRLATTIAIVTSGREGNWVGMAATAVTSVTADPPTILVAANTSASMIPTLEQEGRFCVNLLSERHCDLVRVFSGALKGAERFTVGDWRASDEGLPILSDAVSSLICDIKSTVDVGTHRLLIGEVQSVVNHPQIDPLIWVDSGFASAARLPQVN